MQETNTDDAEVLQQDSEQEVETPVETPVEAEEPAAEPDWSAELEKSKAEAAKYRAESAKYKAILDRNKVKQSAPVPAPTETLSPKEIALLGQLHEDDMDEVLEYAKYKKIPVGEALKSSVIKTTLKEREEERKSSQVANAGGSKRTSSKLTPEQVLANAHKGIDLKSDDEWNALHEAIAKGR